MHLTNDLLDNKVTRKNIASIKPNKLNFGFVDVNNIKGINTFPIYNDPSGIRSHARPKFDSLLFSSHPSDNYTIKNIHHEKPPLDEIKTLYDFDARMKVHKLPTTNHYCGIMQKMYGLPSKTINIENDAFKMAGIDGISEKQFQKKQWRAEGRGGGGGGDGGDDGDGGGSGAMDVDDIMNDPRMQHVVGSGSASASASASASSSSSSSSSHAGGGPMGPRESSPPDPVVVSSGARKRTTNPDVNEHEEVNIYKIRPKPAYVDRFLEPRPVGDKSKTKYDFFSNEAYKKQKIDDLSTSDSDSETESEDTRTSVQKVIEDARLQKERRKKTTKEIIIDENTYVKFDSIYDKIGDIIESIEDAKIVTARNILDINDLLKSQDLRLIRKNTKDIKIIYKHMRQYERPVAP